MANPQRPYPFFGSKNDTAAIPVSAWFRLLLSPDTLPFSQSCIVRKAHHCKCTTHKDHEFVVVVFDYNGNIVSFFMDRVGDSDNPARSSTSLISVPATPNGSLHDVGASSTRLPYAKDSVYVTQDGSEESILARAKEVHGPYDILSTLETSANTNTMNAAHVAILLHAVSQLKPLYDANATQCYWFAHSVFQVIKSVTKCEEKPGANFNMRGKFYMLSVVKPEKSKDAQQGGAVRSKSKGQGNTEGRDSWKKFAKLTPGQGPDVQAVLVAYNIAVAAVKKTWEEGAAAAEQARRNELDAKQVDEERKKAAAAGKKAAAAEKIAVDEKAAAAAAKHNEEIAKQIAEEERAAAAAARNNEEIAKKQAEEERLKAEEAVKYAAELEEVVRALKAQVGVQEGI